MVRRDVKPENILLDMEGPLGPGGAHPALLTDFGVAKLIDTPRRTKATKIIGTPDYLAPEIVEGLPPRAAVDIYGAWRSVLYELVAGLACAFRRRPPRRGAAPPCHLSAAVPPLRPSRRRSGRLLVQLPRPRAPAAAACAPPSLARTACATVAAGILAGMPPRWTWTSPDGERDGAAVAGVATSRSSPRSGAGGRRPRGGAARSRWCPARLRPDSNRDTHTSACVCRAPTSWPAGARGTARAPRARPAGLAPARPAPSAAARPQAPAHPGRAGGDPAGSAVGHSGRPAGRLTSEPVSGPARLEPFGCRHALTRATPWPPAAPHPGHGPAAPHGPDLPRCPGPGPGAGVPGWCKLRAPCRYAGGVAVVDVSEELKSLSSTMGSIEAVLDLDALRADIAALEEQAAAPSLWDDPEAAQKITSKLSHLQAEVREAETLRGRIDDLSVRFELAEDEGDAEALAEAETELESVRKALDEMEVRTLLSERVRRPRGTGDRPGRGRWRGCRRLRRKLQRTYLRWGGAAQLQDRGCAEPGQRALALLLQHLLPDGTADAAAPLAHGDGAVRAHQSVIGHAHSSSRAGLPTASLSAQRSGRRNRSPHHCASSRRFRREPAGQGRARPDTYAAAIRHKSPIAGRRLRA
ncbi:Peptide chain release factor 2 [Streptomyces microflavus]